MKLNQLMVLSLTLAVTMSACGKNNDEHSNGGTNSQPIESQGAASLQEGMAKSTAANMLISFANEYDQKLKDKKESAKIKICSDREDSNNIQDRIQAIAAGSPDAITGQIVDLKDSTKALIEMLPKLSQSKRKTALGTVDKIIAHQEKIAKACASSEKESRLRKKGVQMIALAKVYAKTLNFLDKKVAKKKTVKKQPSKAPVQKTQAAVEVEVVAPAEAAEVYSSVETAPCPAGSLVCKSSGATDQAPVDKEYNLSIKGL